MINYNRDLFDKAGVAYLKQGWTWDEFRETAKALTVKDAAGAVTQFGYEVPNQSFFVQPWFSNGTSASASWSASNHARPQGRREPAVPPRPDPRRRRVAHPGKDVMDNQFMAGQIAMISRGHWIVQSAKRANLNMDIAIPPTKESDTTVIGFGGYAVSRRASTQSSRWRWSAR